MKHHDWNTLKNEFLKRERGVCFEDVVTAINEGRLLGILEHHNSKKYPNQKMYAVEIEGYVYMAPFVEDKNKRFLKTVFPSRKMTKKYIIEGEKQ